LFENDRVRVLDVRMQPGSQSARHEHPDAIWYLMSPMKARFTGDDGSAAEGEFPAGAVWRDAEAHAVENIGATEVSAVAIELK
jgi:quercetin dioxygenase-like cupin family protein